MRQPKLMPDATRPGMWRVRWPDGRLSDITNLTRAKDAINCFMETEERRRRRRHSPSEGRLCVKTDSWGKDSSGLSVNLGLFKGKRRARVCAGNGLAQSNPNSSAKGACDDRQS
jgi:hypothetical protein